MVSGQLHPHKPGNHDGNPLFAIFDGLTATRNRDRGAWVRPDWYVLKNGRFAMNKSSATLVTAGGIDGAGPGIWEMIEDSVFVGVSQNNVDRFGPCPFTHQPYENHNPIYGCIDQTAVKSGKLLGGDEIGKGYPDPSKNTQGYMIYDGPARLVNNRFVNFQKDIIKEPNPGGYPGVTKNDRAVLEQWSGANSKKKYEGDPALGWMQSNQSSYPTGTISEKLIFENTDLRHQIYTEHVNLAAFQDGDKNTAIMDKDGSLSGLKAVAENGSPLADLYPISLNNLMFNAYGNSVDECEAEGEQDADIERRPTSLMSAGSMGTLEFNADFPYITEIIDEKPKRIRVKQKLTFTKDYPDFGTHQAMVLTSRNSLGIWEPKLTSGVGYTVTAQPAIKDPKTGDLYEVAGIPNVVDVGVADVIKPGISKDQPFYVRMGLCYTNIDKSHPDGAKISITKGYKSYGGGAMNFLGDDLRKYWNRLDGSLYMNGETPDAPDVCFDLDGVNSNNYNTCPAFGIALKNSSCPSGTLDTKDRFNKDICRYPKTPLTATDTLSKLENAGKPQLDKFFYNKTTGMLYFYVAQTAPNAHGPSPLGSCTGAASDPAECPNQYAESYYPCPAQGCETYVVKFGDVNYEPGPSMCDITEGQQTKAPTAEHKLVYMDNTEVTAIAIPNPDTKGRGEAFPHYGADRPDGSTCPKSDGGWR